ncbi:class I SAM-dependent methyltransferase [Bacillus sp. 1NLA3E]|uniref:class I SAM-dependent methyltransferase n=1 Tax=Bacillus sp. 1NLA3E TaxID=666686 RepID=UPI000247F474|nr:class I SAM-dependent methyltransferase [Bacillus sp. 1NLA3E]AGK53773.1 type 11 methyltransferase [Bacillus sp. 1NLA3E]
MSRSFAKWYDFFMGPLERKKFKGIRQELLKKARGRVLEIGSGTGLNFPLYDSVDSVTAIEPNQHMINQSIPKKELAVVPVEIIKADAENLPFEDGTFDSVVATLVFCTIPDVEKALKEMKRVCKQGGDFLLFEHVKMDNSFLARLQNWLTPVWKKVCDGCCLNRDTVELINRQGFHFVKVQKFYKGLFVIVEMRK